MVKENACPLRHLCHLLGRRCTEHCPIPSNDLDVLLPGLVAECGGRTEHRAQSRQPLITVCRLVRSLVATRLYDTDRMAQRFKVRSNTRHHCCNLANELLYPSLLRLRKPQCPGG